MWILHNIYRLLVHSFSSWASLLLLIQRTQSLMKELGWNLWQLVCFYWSLEHRLDSILVMPSTLPEIFLPDSSQPWQSGGQMFLRKLYNNLHFGPYVKMIMSSVSWSLFWPWSCSSGSYSSFKLPLILVCIKFKTPN